MVVDRLDLVIRTSPTSRRRVRDYRTIFRCAIKATIDQASIDGARRCQRESPSRLLLSRFQASQSQHRAVKRRSLLIGRTGVTSVPVPIRPLRLIQWMRRIHPSERSCTLPDSYRSHSHPRIPLMQPDLDRLIPEMLNEIVDGEFPVVVRIDDPWPDFLYAFRRDNRTHSVVRQV